MDHQNVKTYFKLECSCLDYQNKIKSPLVALNSSSIIKDNAVKHENDTMQGKMITVGSWNVFPGRNGKPSISVY